MSWAFVFPNNEVCSGSISIATKVDAWIEYYVITYKAIGKKINGTNLRELKFILHALLKCRDSELTNLGEEIFVIESKFLNL